LCDLFDPTILAWVNTVDSSWHSSQVCGNAVVRPGINEHGGYRPGGQQNQRKAIVHTFNIKGQLTKSIPANIMRLQHNDIYIHVASDKARHAPAGFYILR
jgi:hypothetical protein